MSPTVCTGQSQKRGFSPTHPFKSKHTSGLAREEARPGNESLCLIGFFLQSQPARSCVTDYDYFRIRRLVRLFGGFYLLRVAAHQ